MSLCSLIESTRECLQNSHKHRPLQAVEAGNVEASHLATHMGAHILLELPILCHGRNVSTISLIGILSSQVVLTLQIYEIAV